MRDLLLTNWHFLRVLRLGMALVFFSAYYQQGETVALFAGLFFGVQAVFNTGCGPAGCATGPMDYKKTNDVKEIEYEEVK